MRTKQNELSMPVHLTTAQLVDVTYDNQLNSENHIDYALADNLLTMHFF